MIPVVLKHFAAIGRFSVPLVALLAWSVPAAAQSPDTNFFLVMEGADFGADAPALEISDQYCAQLAYAAELGDGEWRAYLNGSEAEGEGGEMGRDRIGAGPFINGYGVVIAETVGQLHSDDTNLTQDTAVDLTGSTPSPDVFTVPPGSALDAADFSREGPFFCFKLPG